MLKKNEFLNTKNYFKLFALSILVVFITSCKYNSLNTKKKIENNIQHGIVYYKEDRFAGWPANHGIWIWDNEILVGFIEAHHKNATGHNLDPSTAKNKYARSKDGGISWIIEDAYEHGQTALAQRHVLSEEESVTPIELTNSIEDFTNPDFILTFSRMNNDDGPSIFYYSKNRGVNWEGPFKFPNVDSNGVATRTDYIIDGKKNLNAFLTVAKSNRKTGRVALSRTTDGGLSWKLVSYIGNEHEGFDMMPTSLRLSPTEFLTVIRTKKQNGLQLLSSYYSNDNGETWEKLKDPVADTGRSGSPPALVELNDGRLALSYIYRSMYGSRLNIRFSTDKGRSWSDEIILRSGDGANWDVGYPRMVQRSDGKLLIIYYWNNVNQIGGKPFRYIASTNFDPNLWN